MMHCSKWTFTCGHQHWIVTVASLRVWTLPGEFCTILAQKNSEKFCMMQNRSQFFLQKEGFWHPSRLSWAFHISRSDIWAFLCYPDLALGPWQCTLVPDSSIAPLRLLLSLSHFFKFSLSPLSMSSLLTSVTLDSSFHFTFLDISNLFGNPLCLIASKLHAPLLGTSALDFVVDLTLCPSCNKTPPTLLV